MKRTITGIFVLSALLCFSQSNVVAAGTDAAASRGSVSLSIKQIYCRTTHRNKTSKNL